MYKFDIDKYLNPYLWPNQVHRVPKPVDRFLGAMTRKDVPDYLLWIDILVGTFCGIAIIEGVFKSHTVFSNHNGPLIVASYGASAILCFNVSASPLAQPRNLVMGQFVSSLIGLCIQKLFLLSQLSRDHYWAGGALSVALLSVAMSILNCVHPPGGASALLPSVDEGIRLMSWWYIPVQIVSSLLMLAVACLFGGLVRSYPTYWWTPKEVGPPHAPTPSPADVVSAVELCSLKHNFQYDGDPGQLVIAEDWVTLPANLVLSELEKTYIEDFQKRLREAKVA